MRNDPGSRWCRSIPAASCLVGCCVIAPIVATARGVEAATYYLDSASGDDSAAGTSPSSAWRSLARVGQTRLQPGDQLLLRAETRFSGMLQLDVRGNVDRPIVVGSYGLGRSVIDGAGQTAAVHLVNPAYVTVRGIELINADGPYGILITAENSGALGQLVLEDLEIHDVYQPSWQAPANAAHDEQKYFGGIHIAVRRGQRPSWWTGIEIRGCRLHDLGTCGISIGSAYPLHAQRRARSGQDAFPIQQVRIHRNEIRDIARDGAIVRQCRGAVIEHNQVARTGRVSISNGLWFWDCEDSTIRCNVGYECRVQERVDGGPFSIDYYCRDCTIEYNYSHDNEGPGVMAFGNHGTGQGTVIRGNVSYNDATAESNAGFAALSLISTIRETIVEENIVIAGPATRRLLGHHDWQGMPIEVGYRGNVFVGNGQATVEPSVLEAGRFEGNLFLNVPGLPEALGVDHAGPVLVDALERFRRVKENAGNGE